MKTDPLLGDRLVTLRAVQWIMGLRDDPYALLLRTASEDPHELGRRIRDRGELYRSHTGAWVTAGHRTARAILRDGRLSARAPAVPDEPIPTLRGVLPLDTGFGEPAFPEEIAATEFEGLSGRFDLAVLARRLALRAVSVPDRRRLEEAYAGVAVLLDATMCPPRTATAHELLRSVAELGELTGAAVGAELTANLVCETVAALLDRPDQWAAVHADPALAHAAIGETLRWAPPIRLQARFATEDLTLAGQPVHAGEEVVIAVGAAERDPRAHPEPDRFDLHRAPTERLMPPGLVGTRVAAAAVATLAAELPGLRRTGDVLRRIRSPVTSGVLSFPAEAAKQAHTSA